MVVSFFVNAMQVDFASVLAMEHTGMVRMFKYLEETGLNRFLEASSSVLEGDVTEFFSNEKVIAWAITVVEMRRKFSGTDLPFRASNKKNEMKIEYRLLHDIVAKKLCAKAGSIDVVTSEKFDLMVAISAGLKVNWAQVLFHILIAMVHNPSRQSQCFVVQFSVLLKRLVKSDLGKAVKLHPQKMLNNKSIHTYMKKNLGVGSAGETSKVSGATASEQQSTANSLQSLTKNPEKEASEMKKPDKAAAEKKKKKKKKKKEMLFRWLWRSQWRLGAKMLQRSPNLRQAQTLQCWSGPEIPAAADDVSTVGAPEANLETNPEVERQADDASNTADQDAHVDCTDKTDISTVTDEGVIVVRHRRKGKRDLGRFFPVEPTGGALYVGAQIRVGKSIQQNV
ncbi:hypothetical protein F511_20830 [Dorcoceras hygrometricum]|uniref:Uncharacterized protein n=1 Tax=Dorcoceras hygrometricum TaxID=472368 RepID=A0A2Z7A6Y6_9LAMI|nr:hypothetical protein F511_20830 [Dorcoceras hygrometricum]